MAALIPDLAQGPPDVAVLTGYLGKDTTADFWRLYLDERLTEWLVLPADAVLYTQDLPDGQGTTVWVRADAAVAQHQHRASGSVEARYLRGPIAERLGGASPGGSPQLLPISRLDLCDTRMRSDCLPCPSDIGIRCPTRTQSGCLPCPTTTASDCVPCPTRTQSDCVPCPTVSTPSDCVPCGTRLRSDCLPCPSDIGIRCPTYPIGCPSNVLRCQTRPQECFPERLSTDVYE